MFFSFLLLTRHPFSDDCKTIQKNHRGSADYSVLTVFIVPDENSDSPLLLVTSKYPKVGAFLCPTFYTNKFVTCCYKKARTFCASFYLCCVCHTGFEPVTSTMSR